MRRLRWTAVLVLAAACGGPDVTTPRGSMRALHEAIVDGDFDRATRFVQGAEEERRVARAMFEFTGAARRFHERMVEHYGSAGWERFNDSEGITLSFGMAEESWPERIQFEEKGDRVLLFDPATPSQKVPLVFEDNRWKLAWAAAVAGRNAPGAEFWQALRALVESRLEKIGSEGVTPDSLDAEMGAAFQKIWSNR